MPDRDIESRIRERVDAFVAELSDLIRESALASVEEAIGRSLGAPAPRARAAAPRGRAAAAPRRKKKGGRRARRSPEDLESMGAQVVDHVRANPGQRLEEISEAMNIDGDDLRQPIQLMRTEGQLRTEGKARGTRYFIGSGTPTRRKKKAGKKKGARRKKRVTKK